MINAYRCKRKLRSFCYRAGVTEKGLESTITFASAALMLVFLLLVAFLTNGITQHDDNIDDKFINQDHINLN